MRSFPFLMREKVNIPYSVIFIDVMSGNPKTWARFSKDPVT